VNTIEQLIGGYDKQLSLHNYRVLMIDKFNKGKISYEKAIRLEAKVNQWIKVQGNRN
jgi:hypothetical protein